MESLIDRVKGTFRGGVHPPQSKSLTEDCAIQQGAQPKEVTIMLSQHTGAICEPQVKKGDAVTAGQKIGDNSAFVSAPVHSPINGKVKDISLQPHAVLGRGMGIVIEAASETEPLKAPCADKFKEDFDETKYSPQQICEAVRNAGIVGMGGAGFPTRVKIEPNPKQPKETLIINGCECEPYITCDFRVMMEWTSQVIAGIKLARRATGCKRVLIGIEDNKPEAIDAMKEALQKGSNSEGIEVVRIETKYPQGGERQLIESVLSRNVPSGQIPPMIGVVVLNVATCAAIAEAVALGNPLTHRVVTVTGQAIARPGNFYVPVGESIGRLIDFCGGATEKSAKVVIGGPMMGLAISDLSTPVTKTTGSITILTEKQIGRAKLARQETPCIRCGRCIDACPERLNPTRIAHSVKCGDLDLAQKYFMTVCIECGCCSYVCPANIELTGFIKTGKVLLARQKKKIPG